MYNTDIRINPGCATKGDIIIKGKSYYTILTVSDIYGNVWCSNNRTKKEQSINLLSERDNIEVIRKNTYKTIPVKVTFAC